MPKAPPHQLVLTGLAVLLIGNGVEANEGRAILQTPREFAPFVIRQSKDYTCGAAALANLFRFQFGQSVTEGMVLRQMAASRSHAAIRARGGFSFLDMADYAATHGYLAKGEGNLSLDQLTARLPAIIQVDTQRDAAHFIVVLERQGEYFAVADPAKGGLLLQAEDLAARWTGAALVLSGF